MTRATTILCVRHKGKVAMAGDGQVTMHNVIVKERASKIRRLYQDKILVGFSGAAADALALLQRFEEKLEEYHGNLLKSAYELAREWRTDRYLRRLESLLVAADSAVTLLISGSGEVIEPDDGVIGIGSGGPYAAAAARALVAHSDLNATEIVEAAMKIAAKTCVYTNDQVRIEAL